MPYRKYGSPRPDEVGYPADKTETIDRLLDAMRAWQKKMGDRFDVGYGDYGCYNPQGRIATPAAHCSRRSPGLIISRPWCSPKKIPPTRNAWRRWKRLAAQ